MSPASPAIAPDAREDDPIDALRRSLACTLCNDVLKDPTTLPCQHTYCFECVSATLQGSGVYDSKCPECAVPVVAKELIINQTIKSFVDGFAASERALEEMLESMARVGREDVVDDKDDEDNDVGRCEAEDECVELTKKIRHIDAVLKDIDARLAKATEDEERKKSAEARTRELATSLDFERMTLTQLRAKYRELYDTAPAKNYKKAWFVRHFSSLDPDVLTSAFCATQPTSPLETQTGTQGRRTINAETTANAPKKPIVIAYSASTKRGINSQEAKFAQVEATIKSIDPTATFLGLKDLTPDVTHLIMETGSGDRVVKNRTAKYIEAIVRGLYIVHKDWLDACAESGAFGDEESFELEDASSADAVSRGSIDGPRRARLRRLSNGSGVFDGLRIAVRGCGATLSVKALENILRLAGATVTDANATSPRPARVVVEEDSEQVPDSEDDDNDDTNDGTITPAREQSTEPTITLVDDATKDAFDARENERLVSWRWALECVTRYERLDTHNWCVGNDAKHDDTS